MSGWIICGICQYEMIVNTPTPQLPNPMKSTDFRDQGYETQQEYFGK